MDSKTAAGSQRRNIPDDFTYNPKKLKHLKHILHNVSVALGTLSSSLNEFAKLKGPEVSPDGMLGGIGYILPIRDIKQALNTSIHSLGNVADCIADELTNPHWNAHEDKEVKELLKEKEDVEEQIPEEIGPDDVVTVEDMEKTLDKEGAIRSMLASAIRRRLIQKPL